tara:strand:- start:54 stop:605 length:552 start_codon:yes stop_codon:yes gene_type:complete
MKTNRTSKWWLIGLVAGWLSVFSGTAADANASDLNATDANATVTVSSANPDKIYGLPNDETRGDIDSASLGEVFFRILGALLAVLALLLGGAYWFRKSRLFGLVPVSESNLKIVETKTLASRHALHVIEYGEQKFLIADSPAGTNFLTNLEGGVEAELPNEEPDEPAPGSFAEKLKNFIHRKS